MYEKLKRDELYTTKTLSLSLSLSLSLACMQAGILCGEGVGVSAIEFQNTHHNNTQKQLELVAEHSSTATWLSNDEFTRKRPFLMNQVTAGHKVESEAVMCFFF